MCYIIFFAGEIADTNTAAKLFSVWRRRKSRGANEQAVTSAADEGTYA